MLCRRSPVLLVVALLAALSLPADAADPCGNARSTYEMNQCADRDYLTADAKLNDAYAKALSFVATHGAEAPYDSASWEKALRASQKAWIAFRDADCKGLVPMTWGGGTATTVAVLGCMTAKTKTRTEELVEIFRQG